MERHLCTRKVDFILALNETYGMELDGSQESIMEKHKKILVQATATALLTVIWKS